MFIVLLQDNIIAEKRHINKRKIVLIFKMFLSILFYLLSYNLANNIRYFDYEKEFLNLFIYGGKYYRSCHEINFHFDKPKISNATDLVVNNTLGNKIQCPFRPSFSSCVDRSKAELSANCLADDWYCLIEQKNLCDNISICLIDECNCPNSNNPLFFCADGRGCISLKMACDGGYDCLDQSDEMVCDGLVDFTCKSTDGISVVGSVSNTFSVTKYIFCSNVDSYKTLNHLEPFNGCDRSNCKNHDISTVNLSGHQNSEQCIRNIRASDIDDDEYMERRVNFTFLCVEYCKNLVSEETCKHFKRGITGIFISFHCITLTSRSNFQEVAPSLVCDGNFDCRDKSDELHCLNRFYCTTPESELVSWVPQSAVCNNYKDCENGIDECSNCSDGLLSSDQFLVRNLGIFAWLVFSCVFNFIMNTLSAKIDFTSQWKNKPMYFKVDKILKLQLCFYDVLMGLYLLSLVIAYIKFYGQYCMFDHEWRYGWICKIVGILYNLSTHGSLLTVFLMSLARAYKCTHSFSQGISLKKIVPLSIVLGTMNFANSVIPVLPLEEIQNIFRVKMTFSQSNPFIMNEFENISHVNRIHSKYFGENASSIGLYQKLEALKSITNTPDIFNYNELSFYSWSPVCVQDIYGFREPLEVYKRVYITVILTILISITYFYIIILKASIKSRIRVNPVGENDQEIDLMVKVSLIIGTKLISWLTILGAMVYYNLTKKYVPDEWFEITAICIIPINSLLNPVFNTDLLKSLSSIVITWCCKNSEQEKNEMELQPVQQIVST